MLAAWLCLLTSSRFPPFSFAYKAATSDQVQYHIQDCIINNQLSAQRLKKLCFFCFFPQGLEWTSIILSDKVGNLFNQFLKRKELCFLTFFLMTLTVRNDIHSKFYLLAESKIKTLTLCPVHNCGNQGEFMATRLLQNILSIIMVGFF